MSTLTVDIVAAEEQIFSGEATAVFVPAISGDLGILPRHAPLLTKLKAGTVRVQNGDKMLSFYVSGGIIEVQPTLVTILADSALRAEAADETAALESQKRAAEALAGAKETHDVARAQADLVEANARLKFAQELKKLGR